MPENIQKIFTSNLNRLLSLHGKTQLELAKYLKVSNTTVNNWAKGYNTPRMDKIDRICAFFKVAREDLLKDQKDGAHTPAYYTDPETAKVAQEIYDNKELRVLFDAARNASSEDLATATNVLKALLAKERGSEDAD
ncbi:DNA-binding helix-turn-helix protein [Oribacterium sp. oral taxon 078 str. F0263]|uniref:helix-turn-helix transcriptional regulator n=1 Tax=Oribacterium sp. oral taxon 078 TaxID=652706 RepID=UPI0003AE57F4|nr:helix-turn-helix transcriptional regulator [Oribacterium sp. oral taxon 078]ERL19786.1 DNA-binding helix-turn-helix protein [Oribacterium sp. oral taxon 078 str. F0263]